MPSELTLIRLDREFGGDAPGDQIAVLASMGRILEEGGTGRIVGGDADARAHLRKSQRPDPLEAA